MACLTDRPELIGFFSYSREDDVDSQGALSALRTRIQGELRGQLGRTAKTFHLWQDKEAIPSGSLWEGEIKTAVAQSVFFIPIITPTVVASPHCKFELESFLAREAELGRDDLIFPILYIDVPSLTEDGEQTDDPVLSIIAKRQYKDWRKLRHRDVRTTDVSEAVELFCKDIRNALRRSWLLPDERKQHEEALALQRAESERQRQEAEAKRLADAQARQHEAEQERRRRDAEAEQRRKETAEAKQREEAEARHRREAEADRKVEEEARRGEVRRLRDEAEAKRRAEAEEHRRLRGSQPPPDALVAAIKSGCKQAANFSGRASRSQFWYWMLFSLVIFVAAAVLDSGLALVGIRLPIFKPLSLLALLLPTLAVSVRRMHDLDYSGWWILISLLPFGIAVPVILVGFFFKGTPGTNRFGPDPLGSDISGPTA